MHSFTKLQQLSLTLCHKNLNVLYKTNYIYFLAISSMLIFGSCAQSKAKSDGKKREVTDSFGRRVIVSDTIRNIITMKAGALRMICYMGVQNKVKYIEKNDITRKVPYMMANPQLKNLEVLGVGNNFDTESLAMSTADVIIATYMTAAEADALQSKINKPVFLLQYGDMGTNIYKFYNSLKVLGTLFYRSERADSLVQFIQETQNELKKRSGQNIRKTSAYIGGIAFNGAQGITSTRAQYPPFLFLDIHNDVDDLKGSLESIGDGQKNMLIDPEQILLWNPKYLFLDAAGSEIWSTEIDGPTYSQLGCLRNNQVFSVLPFNWHSINYENLLCNAWFVGKTIYPESFADIDVETESRKIYRFFLGQDVYDDMNKLYKPFQNIRNDQR
jgi:iron complex transport system substrate-binding protein